MKAPALVRLRFWSQIYARSRDWGRLVPGLPAALVFVSALLVFLLFRYRPANYQANYIKLAQQSMRAEKYADARFYYERLMQDDAKRPDYQFGYANVLLKQGFTPSAVAILERLAPLEAEGYRPAHLALAEMELTRQPPTADDLRQAEQHLTRVIQKDPKNIEANAKLGDLYLRTNRADRAQEFLEVAIARDESLSLALARIQQQLKRPPDFGGWATRAEAHFRKLSAENPGDINARLAVAEAVLLRGKVNAALELLNATWRANPTPACRLLLGKAYIAALSDLVPLGRSLSEQQMEQVEGALQFDPLNPVLTQTLIKLMRPDDMKPDEAAATIQKLADRHPRWAGVQLYLWVDALKHKDPMAAARHLTSARELNPSIGNIVNQMATFIVLDIRPNYAFVLEMMNGVVEQWPSDANFHRTRGNVLVKLQRWREAVVDLEAALPALKDNADLHQDLAVAYDRLGRKDEAKEQELEAARLRVQPEK